MKKNLTSLALVSLLASNDEGGKKIGKAEVDLMVFL